MSEFQLPKPSPDLGDFLHTTLKVAIGAFPIIGPAAAEFFGLLVSAPYSRRQQEYLELQLARLSDSAAADLTIEEFQKHEAFISTITAAARMAVATHEREKIDSLCNAVTNVACGNPLGDHEHGYFMGLIDALTVQHLLLLRCMHALPAPADSAARLLTVRQVVETQLPQFVDQSDLLHALEQDLDASGVCSLGIGMSWTTGSTSTGFRTARRPDSVRVS